MINSVTFDIKQNLKLIQQGKWDAAFKAAGDMNVGFDFAGSPFGNDKFDFFPVSWITSEYKYQDVFTGFLFYLPLDKHVFEKGVPGLFDGFKDEVLRRSKCISDDYYQNKIKYLEEFKVRKRIDFYGKDILEQIEKWLIFE